MLIKGKTTSKPYTSNYENFRNLQSTIDILAEYHRIEKHRQECEILEHKKY